MASPINFEGFQVYEPGSNVKVVFTVIFKALKGVSIHNNIQTVIFTEVLQEIFNLISK